MPKIITPAMRAHLDAETTRLCTAWRIERRDGQSFFFTDHDRDLVCGGNTYLTATASIAPRSATSEDAILVSQTATAGGHFRQTGGDEAHAILWRVRGRKGRRHGPPRS